MTVLSEDVVLSIVQEMIAFAVPGLLIEIVAMLCFCDVARQVEDSQLECHGWLFVCLFVCLFGCLVV